LQRYNFYGYLKYFERFAADNGRKCARSSLSISLFEYGLAERVNFTANCLSNTFQCGFANLNPPKRPTLNTQSSAKDTTNASLPIFINDKHAKSKNRKQNNEY
jgi:hypothetical protein